MIATSALNRDVFDLFGKWKSGHSLSVLPKAKRNDPKTGTVAGASDILESVTGTRARQRSMSIMLKKKGVFDAMRAHARDILVVPFVPSWTWQQHYKSRRQRIQWSV